MSERTEIMDYKVEFDGKKPTDVPDIQAAMIMIEVLNALDVGFEEMKIKRFVKYTFEATKGDVTIKFVGEKPEDWYAEADIREKILEVGINNHRMRIPLMTILYWFSKGEKNDMK